ncbi:hypothetical protein [Lachnoclostridium phytofermentans]|uniref:DUF3592 domain-containing protein n=1 Tax=Lachnoclostridium phytofermentans (strain ATCC 700394 / DSM 18823 / ISDg) TaxID=357809 RepID=A9KJ03_LACP7|nr:hypothetical protein [Lachnoclostridium phytofermentans]ABX41002.1 hypothetical protein Cphy_0615 [Lachnoclostridium phytofermentans ISDg]
MERQDGYYDEKEDRKERISNASLWIVLTIISTFLFFFTVTLNIKEVILKYNGNIITTGFKEKTDRIMIQKDDGSYHVLNIGGIFPSHRENEIDLYYYGDDVTTALPLTMIGFWIFVEFFFAGFTVLCFHLARKNLKTRKNLISR